MNSLSALSRLLSHEDGIRSSHHKKPGSLVRARSMPAIALAQRAIHRPRRNSLQLPVLSSDDESGASDTSNPPSKPAAVDSLSSLPPKPTSLPIRIAIALFALVRKLLSSVGINIDLPAQFWSLPHVARARLLIPSVSSPDLDHPPAPTKAARPRNSIWHRALDRRKTPYPPNPSPDASGATPLSSRRASFALFTNKPRKPEARHRAIPVLKPKTLILDLDETLIHSTNRIGGLAGVSTWGNNGLSVRLVEVVMDGKSTVYHVYKRPWVDFFLKKVAAWYTVVIFTASMQEYADPVIDWLDQGRGLINGRFFRESCIFHRGTYYKDLSTVDEDLSSCCLVDNSPTCYAKNPANGIPIEGWVGDKSDECLLDLLPLLDSLRFTSDVRRVLGIRGFGIQQHIPVPP